MLARIIQLDNGKLELVFFDSGVEAKLIFDSIESLDEMTEAIVDARNEFVDNLAGDSDESKERT